MPITSLHFHLRFPLSLLRFRRPRPTLAHLPSIPPLQCRRLNVKLLIPILALPKQPHKWKTLHPLWIRPRATTCM